MERLVTAQCSQNTVTIAGHNGHPPSALEHSGHPHRSLRRDGMLQAWISLAVWVHRQSVIGSANEPKKLEVGNDQQFNAHEKLLKDLHTHQTNGSGSTQRQNGLGGLTCV